MSVEKNTGLTLLVCSVFEAELRSLARIHWPEARVVSVNSILHIRPSELAVKLEELVASELKSGQRVVLLYGDCHSRMDILENTPGVARVHGMNCCAILLGKDDYRSLVREGAFFLLPEWTRRWREIFTQQLGLNSANAHSLMCDMHRKIIFLDTGVAPVPADEIKACAEYCGLPWEIRAVNLDLLRAMIEEAVQRVNTSSTAL